MGNCECVTASKTSFGDIDQNDNNPKLKILTSDQHPIQAVKNDSLISFSTISIKNLTNSKNTATNIPRTFAEYDRRGNFSKNSKEISLNEQFQNNKQGELIPQLEINSKLSLKEYYDLKKLIEKVNHTFQELDIKKSFFGYQRADLAKIYDQNFIKIHIKTEQIDQIGFFRGETKEYFGKTILSGQGELYFASGAYYNGTFHKNQFHKTGIFIHSDKDYYYGTWKKNKASGFGEFHHYQGVIYKGEWKNDVQDGIGEEYWPDGAYFRGYFSGGNKRSGKFQWPNKSSYSGQFVNNKFQGKGKFVWQDKRCYQGSWKNNLMHGYGVFSWQNGQIFKGMYQNQKKQGPGELILADGTQIKGNWVNGKLQGQAQVTKDGKTTNVQWKNGLQV